MEIHDGCIPRASSISQKFISVDDQFSAGKSSRARKIVVKVAESGDSCINGPNGVRRPIQSNLIRDLVFQRKEAQDMKIRRKITKEIHKQSRKELRLWKIKWVERLLERFKNTKYVQKIKVVSIQSSVFDPVVLTLSRRDVGHPRLRWDDHIRKIQIIVPNYANERKIFNRIVRVTKEGL